MRTSPVHPITASLTPRPPYPISPTTLQNRPDRNPRQHRHPSTGPLRYRPTLERHGRRSRRTLGRGRYSSGAAGGGVGAAEGEVGAGQARGVGGVDDDGAVAEEGGGAGGGGEVEVEEAGGGGVLKSVGYGKGGWLTWR